MATVEELYAQLQSNISGSEAVEPASPVTTSPETDALYSQLKSNISAGPQEQVSEAQTPTRESIGGVTGRDYSQPQQGFNADYKMKELQALPPLENEGETGPLGSFGSFFSGQNRKTAISEALEKQSEDMGFFETQDFMNNMMGGSKNAARYEAETMAAFNPMEQAQIAKKINPEIEIKIEKDAQGKDYPILINSRTGQASLVNEFGADPRDAAKAIGTGMLFLRGKGTGSLLKQAGKEAVRSAGIQTAIEGQQKLSGGTFDPVDVAIAGGAGGLGEVATPLAKKAFQGSKASLAKAKELISGIKSGADDLPVNVPRTPEQVAKIRSEEGARGFETDELGNLIGGDGGRQAQISQALQSGDEARLAKMIDADPQFFKDKDALGLIEEGVPTQSSKSKQIQQTGESFAKIQGSDLFEKVKSQQKEIGEKADELVNKFGATDKGDADFGLFEGGAKAIDDLSIDETKMYKDITETIGNTPESRSVKLNGVKESILDEASSSAKGIESLDSLQKEILDYAENGATYRDLDRLRRKVGESLHGKKDVFPNVSEGSLKNLYKLLTEDQEKAARELGVGELWDKAKDLTKARIGLQDKAKALFGSKLDDKGVTTRIATSLKGLSEGKPKAFSKLIESLPSGSKEADAKRLQMIGTALKDVFKGGPNKTEGFSVGQFAKWYNNLNSSPAYKNLLYKELPKEMRAKLDSLGRFTTQVDSAAKSGTGSGLNLTSEAAINKIVKSAKGFIGKYVGAMTGGVVNIGETITKSEAKKIAIDKAANVLNSPQFINLVKASANGKEEAVKSIEKKLMQSKGMQELKASLSADKRRALIKQGFVRWMESEYSDEQQTEK